MLNSPCPTLLCKFIETSKDGYGIFDADDMLVFANYTFKDVFCLEQKVDEPISFEQMVCQAFKQKRGIHIEAENAESWLKYVETVRRSQPFRVFEVDMVDGRWFLFSEQLLASGEMLVQCKDMTRQKVTETQLQQSVSRLNKLALTDELTQLANRRCFVESVETELSRCKRGTGSVTMMIIDLDLFKNINDNFGHHAGDAALVQVAGLLKTALRQYDIVGRIGGEEFAIFLGSSDLGTALTIAERVRLSLVNNPLRYKDHSINLSASIGMTSRRCDATFEQLYTEADAALYKAKANGRNRVELFEQAEFSDSNSA